MISCVWAGRKIAKGELSGSPLAEYEDEYVDRPGVNVLPGSHSLPDWPAATDRRGIVSLPSHIAAREHTIRTTKDDPRAAIVRKEA